MGGGQSGLPSLGVMSVAVGGSPGQGPRSRSRRVGGGGVGG